MLVEGTEAHGSFPSLGSRIANFVTRSIGDLAAMEPAALVADRYAKFRGMGKFRLLDAGSRAAELAVQAARPAPMRPVASVGTSLAGGVDVAATPRLLNKLADLTVHGANSAYKEKAPAGLVLAVPPPLVPTLARPTRTNAKTVLDAEGPEAMAAWVKAQPKVRSALASDRPYRNDLGTCLI